MLSVIMLNVVAPALKCVGENEAGLLNTEVVL
jgi:hypothetical protein